ncbi:MAG: sensor domain-containing protein [Pyrinomonadaceae bacterium]
MNNKTKRSSKNLSAENKKLESFRHLLETMPVMIYAAEPRPPYSPIYISPAFEQFGYPLDEWYKNLDLWMKTVHPEDRERVLAETEAAMKSGGKTNLEYRMVARNGEVRWVRDYGRFVEDENGNPISWQGVIVDATERKLAEQELQKRERLYRTLARSIPQTAVVLFDRDFRYTLADGVLLEKHGFSKKMFEGKTLWEVFPPDICEEWASYYRRALSGEIVSLEQTDDAGSFQIYVVPVKNECGEIFAGMVMWQDIAERKQGEEALRESERRYRQMFEKNQAVKFIIDADTGAFVDVNPAACKFYGYSRAEFKTKNITDINTLPAEQIVRELKEAKRERRSCFHFQHRLASGEVRDVEVHSSPLQDQNQNLLYSIVQDVTERKQAERALKESEERYRDLFENANDLIYVHDLEGNYISANRTAERVFGYTLEEALKMNIKQVVVPEHLEIVRRNLSAKSEGTEKSVYEVDCLTKDGRRITLEINSRTIFKDGAAVAVQGIARDITERKQAEEILRDREEQYRELFENANDLIYTHDLAGNFTSLNRAGELITGYSRAEALQMNIAQVVAPDYLAAAQRMRHRKIADDLPTVYELEIIAKQGHRVSLELSTRIIYQNGAAVGVQGIARDITERKRAEAKLNHLAGHDVLTNLPNRAKFMNHLERAVSRSECNSSFRFAVLFLDLDHFKIINDSLGHSIGDKLLIAIAERLESCVRPGDIVARLGGDEFTILLTDIHEPSAAVRVAERFLEKLSAPFKLGTYEVFTSASIGIIISDEIKRQPEDFLRDADTAMYRAKEAGKSRYEIFDREMHNRNMNLLQMETDLRRAIEQNEFRVFYQPIVSFDDGEIQEFEALIRWQHPTRGLVPPNEFIPVAEETGLIIPIGEWILREACRQTAEWRRTNAGSNYLSVSVNLSAKQLTHPNLTMRVAEILRQTALNPRCLKLEVTESMVMENSEKAIAVIAELKSLGISFSTDDFGTGYSSLSYLHRFPFSRLKIDRSFVSRMDADQKSEAIVRTILLLGQNLNIETVAEGIENERQLESLRRLGCRSGQGFLFSKPVNAEAATQLLRDGVPNFFDTMPFDLGDTSEHRFVELDKIQ